MTKTDDRIPTADAQQHAKRKRHHGKHHSRKNKKENKEHEQLQQERVTDNTHLAKNEQSNSPSHIDDVNRHNAIQASIDVQVSNVRSNVASLPDALNQTASTATTTWDFVFRQAASVELLGGDLDHDKTFQPPAAVVDPGLSKIAQLLLSQQKHTAVSSSPLKHPPPFLSTPAEGAVTSNVVAHVGASEEQPEATAVSKTCSEKHEKTKKKRKRKEKEQQKEQKLSRRNNDNAEHVDDDVRTHPGENNVDNDTELCLEGHLVSLSNASGQEIPTMVLVHRGKGIVFSSTQRDETTCDMIQIGEWKHGKVILWKQQQPQEDLANASSSTSSSDDNSGDEGLSESEGVPQFPFSTDPDDHCETPLQAYRDILPFLQFLRQQQQQQQRSSRHPTSSQAPSSLRIYDPYYCNGAVKRHFSTLGLDQVHNVKEDCYQVWEAGATPLFDVLVTNPPYSGDHIERLCKQVMTNTKSSFGNRPWLLLLPNWVHKKDFYKQAIASKGNKNKHGHHAATAPSAVADCQPFYLVPRKRYVYEPPRHFRQAKKSDVHVKSSPFVSMWYIWGGSKEMTDQWYQHYRTWQQERGDTSCQLARTPSALRDLRRRPHGGGKQQQQEQQHHVFEKSNQNGKVSK